MQKSYFLGTSTPNGYQNTLTPLIESGEYVTYILKGGPGTGKSSLMKKISAELSQPDAEFYYCSSDPDSLDAVLFPSLKTIVIDGTSPHVVEPKNAGISEILVDLGACWDREVLLKHKDTILTANAENKALHASVRRYLGAVHTVNSDILSIGEKALLQKKLTAYSKRLCDKILPKKSAEKGKTVIKQITAVTPKGVLHHNSLLENCRIYSICDPTLAVCDTLLKNIAQTAQSRGYLIIIGLNPFISENIYSHLVLPELNIAFTSQNLENAVKVNPLRFYNPNVLKEKRQYLKFADTVTKGIVNQMVIALADAKAVHDTLESGYIKAMDFKKVNEIADKIISDIKGK